MGSIRRIPRADTGEGTGKIPCFPALYVLGAWQGDLSLHDTSKPKYLCHPNEPAIPVSPEKLNAAVHGPAIPAAVQ